MKNDERHQKRLLEMYYASKAKHKRNCKPPRLTMLQKVASGTLIVAGWWLAFVIVYVMTRTVPPTEKLTLYPPSMCKGYK